MNSKRAESGRYFNTLSNIPMLDKGHLVDKSFYKTTYNQEYTSKKRFQEDKVDKIPDFSVYNSYDFRELQERLQNKNNNNNKSSEHIEPDSSQFNSGSFINAESIYYSPSHNSLNDLITESRYSFGGANNIYPYKKPTIPSFIKRDHFFQTNAEKNIKYLSTYTGGLLPIVPSTVKRGK